MNNTRFFLFLITHLLLAIRRERFLKRCQFLHSLHLLLRGELLISQLLDYLWHLEHPSLERLVFFCQLSVLELYLIRRLQVYVKTYWTLTVFRHRLVPQVYSHLLRLFVHLVYVVFHHLYHAIFLVDDLQHALILLAHFHTSLRNNDLVLLLLVLPVTQLINFFCGHGDKLVLNEPLDQASTFFDGLFEHFWA